MRPDCRADMLEAVSHKAERIARMVGPGGGDGMSPYYTGFFERFNRGEYYEAHDVLEQLWLADRHGPNGAFYKGLIQLAGAFVHLQKGRLRPSSALFKLANANLAQYSGAHESLEISTVLVLIAKWDGWLRQHDFQLNPLHRETAPRLELKETDPKQFSQTQS
jgi:hypothetical protein